MKVKEWVKFLENWNADLEVRFLCPDGFEESFEKYLIEKGDDKTLYMVSYRHNGTEVKDF